jgi:hypothetical protein
MNNIINVIKKFSFETKKSGAFTNQLPYRIRQSLKKTLVILPYVEKKVFKTRII